MKTAICAILLASFFIADANAHPIHVSVSNIDILPDSGRLDLSIRVYFDDFQALINHHYQTELDFEKRNRLTSREQDAILDYIGDTFQICADKNDTLVTEFMGWRVENQMVWLFFCGKLPEALPEIQVRNTLLLDLYSDQSNLLIYQSRGVDKGLEFNKRITTHHLELE